MMGADDRRQMAAHKRPLTILLAWSAGHIVLASLEAILLAGPDGLALWQDLFPGTGSSDYTAFVLTRFLADILVPLSLSLYTYLTIHKLGTPPLYRMVWGAIVFLGAMWKFLTFETSSPFWYLSLILWTGLFLTVINIQHLGRANGSRRTQ